MILGVGFDQFTGKERDAETGLDYFGARYMSAAQGRFTSPDEFTGGPYEVAGSRPLQPGPLPYADITNPQSLNKYAYALNNPLRYIDPDGHEEADPNDLNKAPKPKPEPKPQQPTPTTPDGKPTPPPVPVPGAPDVDWKYNPNPQNPRGGTWGPKGWKGPNPPSGSWDPDGHWDINGGKGQPVDHYDPNGRPLTPEQVHPGQRPSAPPGQIIDPNTAAKGAAAIGTGTLIYWIISEGSRLFPPRNLIPIP